MERLPQRDLRTLMEILPTLYQQHDLAIFPTYVLTLLRTLIPTEHASYNVLDVRQRRSRITIDPPDTYFTAESADAQQLFGRYLSQHPVLMHRHAHGDG